MHDSNFAIARCRPGGWPCRVDPGGGLIMPGGRWIVREPMSVVELRKWNATPVEIAVDLEIRGVRDRSPIALSGRAESRITLVVGFASTAQLKRICGAIARAYANA